MEELSRRALIVMGGVATAGAAVFGWPADAEARPHHRPPPQSAGGYSDTFSNTY